MDPLLQNTFNFHTVLFFILFLFGKGKRYKNDNNNRLKDFSKKNNWRNGDINHCMIVYKQ